MPPADDSGYELRWHDRGGLYTRCTAHLRDVSPIMKFELKIKKSAGVSVTPRVHKLIARGNRARHAGDWSAAAAAFQTALEGDPSLYHIWMQLGHALAESYRIEEGRAAYQSAAALRPQSGEPYIHLGHITKREGRPRAAARHYAQALLREGYQDEAEREVVHAIRPVTALPLSLLREVARLDAKPGSNVPAQSAAADTAQDLALAAKALAAAGQLTEADRERVEAARKLIERMGADVDASPTASSGVRPLVFDITDLVAHFRNHRLPTGIQRVQIEVLATALKVHGRDNVGICCFIDGRENWIEIPTPLFLDLAYLATSGSDANEDPWQLVRARLFFHLAVDEHYTMPQDAVLVNLGTSWWIYDYFHLVRDAKEQRNISYIPFVHDFIPIMAPEHCVRGVIEDYVSWVVGVFQHADMFLVNSQSTRNDLKRVAEQLGHTVPDDRIEVVPLDADFRRTSTHSLAASALSAWGLESTPFALFVSTIESRKNHVLAFDAWLELLRRHGADKVPRLVCVGRNGWLNDHAFARLRAHPELLACVTIIHQASDEELALLYRSCQFTVYPSHYEGWGLPITESLCYGKLPVIADNSSLPEAGAGLALEFESNSVTALVAAVEQVAFDTVWRAEREEAIATSFRPRTWAQIAGQINQAVSGFGEDRGAHGVVRRPVAMNSYYPVSLYRDVGIWHGLASGEIYRSGGGWLWPETHGCRTRPDGGELKMDLPATGDDLRLYLRLQGLSGQGSAFEIRVDGHMIVKGWLEPDQVRWVAGDLPAGTRDRISVQIRGTGREIITMSTGGTEKQHHASIAVLGFYLCGRDDEEGRARFLEAAALGTLEDASIYRNRRAA